VIRTRAGYAGGTTKNPTYNSIGDHTETMQIDFDPSIISYKDLLEVFWKSHNPCQEAGTRQYMSAVFVHNDAQKKIAEETRTRAAAQQKNKIVTPILALTPFTLAEDYHQKYYLRQTETLYKEVRAMYADEGAFRDSTAAARVNGYIGGYGTLANLEKDRDQLGLSAAGKQALTKIVKQRRGE
jgi:peptide-methionine (S)-S-oxide reductase